MTTISQASAGTAARIHFAIVDSPLDRLLVAATAKGLCALFMDSRDAPLRRALAALFPAARVEGRNPVLADGLAAILRHLRGREVPLEVPVDVAGTTFQHRVWAALRAIPYGQLRNYGDIARRLGHPGAARAVARACATNPLSVVIPCHRVVLADGGLGGYRWGIERKRALLARESELASPTLPLPGAATA